MLRGLATEKSYANRLGKRNYDFDELQRDARDKTQKMQLVLIQIPVPSATKR